MKKEFWIFFSLALLFFVAGCAFDQPDVPASMIDGMVGEPADFAAWEAQVNADFAVILESLGTDNSEKALAVFDSKYNTRLMEDFEPALRAYSRSAGKGGSNYPPLNDMPFVRDGAVYLSGGATDLVGGIIGWVAPKNLPGGYYHGAVLDLDKVDPNNPETPSLQTAIPKGAGYESVTDWRGKVNASVMNPVVTLLKPALDSAQSWMHIYCRPENTNMEYGFFKNYVNIFNLVTKDDMYTWYCTKVVWHVYNRIGINVDSNDTRVDFKKSGLYSLVKAYYSTLYFWSSSRANNAINAYIADARTKIVLAEEILLSPHLVKVYERIRE